MNKTSIAIAITIVAGLSLSVFALTQEGTIMQPWVGTDAEQNLQQESVECAAYYQLASEAMAKMNAPQMQMVAKRMKSSEAIAKNVAGEYFESEQVTSLISHARDQHLDLVPGPDALGPLMERYKSSCSSLIKSPEQRLEFWREQHSAAI